MITEWPIGIRDMPPWGYFAFTSDDNDDLDAWARVTGFYPFKWLSDALNKTLDVLRNAIQALISYFPRPLYLYLPFARNAIMLVAEDGTVPSLSIPDFDWYWSGFVFRIWTFRFAFRFANLTPTDIPVDVDGNWYYYYNGEYKQGKDFTPMKRMMYSDLIQEIVFWPILLACIYYLSHVIGPKLSTTLLRQVSMSANALSIRSQFDDVKDAVETVDTTTLANKSLLNELKAKLNVALPGTDSISAIVTKALEDQEIKALIMKLIRTLGLRLTVK